MRRHAMAEGRRALTSLTLSDDRVVTIFAPTVALWQTLNELEQGSPRRPVDFLRAVVEACTDSSFEGSSNDAIAIVLAILATWPKAWSDRLPYDDKMALRWRPALDACLRRFAKSVLSLSKLVEVALDPPREINEALGEFSRGLWDPTEAKGAERRVRSPVATLEPHEALLPRVATGPSDEAAFVETLRCKLSSKRQTIALVDYMKGRDSASFDEVKRHVNGDMGVSDDAVRRLVSRANEDVRSLGLRLSYATAGGYVRKTLHPE
jgi:hypothetical protein